MSWADRLLWAAAGAVALFAYQNWSTLQLARKAGTKLDDVKTIGGALQNLFGGDS